MGNAFTLFTAFGHCSHYSGRLTNRPFFTLPCIGLINLHHHHLLANGSSDCNKQVPAPHACVIMDHIKSFFYQSPLFLFRPFISKDTASSTLTKDALDVIWRLGLTAERIQSRNLFIIQDGRGYPHRWCSSRVFAIHYCRLHYDTSQNNI